MKHITKIARSEDVNLNRDFAVRVRSVQEQLGKEGVDALLVISGEDGGSNRASNCFLNWLFKGTSHLDIEDDFHLDPVFEETFFVITQGAFEGWVTEEVLAAYPAHFLALQGKNLRVAPKMDAGTDRNEFEVEKSAAFYDLTLGHKKISVILDTKSNKAAKAKDVENWPLVQTYALEGWFIRSGRRIFHPQKERG